jgi:hypothetical protein
MSSLLSLQPSSQPTSRPTFRPSKLISKIQLQNTTESQFLYYTIALIVIITIVCVVSFCYRSATLMDCCYKKDPSIEVIIETRVEIKKTDPFADADYCEATGSMKSGVYLCVSMCIY